MSFSHVKSACGLVTSQKHKVPSASWKYAIWPAFSAEQGTGADASGFLVDGVVFIGAAQFDRSTHNLLHAESVRLDRGCCFPRSRIAPTRRLDASFVRIPHRSPRGSDFLCPLPPEGSFHGRRCERCR